MRNLTLNIRAKFSREKRLFSQNEHSIDKIGASNAPPEGFLRAATPSPGTVLANFYCRFSGFSRL
jgi:hypothetical protein